MIDQFVKQGKIRTPEPILISELRVGNTIFGWLLAVDVQMRQARNRKSYLRLKLRDQRGNEITANHFEPSQLEEGTPQAGKVVLVEGLVDLFNEQVQIKLTGAELDESVPADLFLQGTRRPIAQLEADFQELLDQVHDPGLRELLLNCFTSEVMARFRRWPAAMKLHGAVVGGLLEHTVNVTMIAKQLSQLYPCDQNLVLAGALLHDIGKLEELDEQIGSEYTPAGRMVGHIVLGVQYIQERARQMADTCKGQLYDEALFQDLLHIILAHHGTKEYGSPVSPATIEATIVHQADTAEAHLTGFLDHCEHTSGSDGWSSSSSVFGGRLRVP